MTAQPTGAPRPWVDHYPEGVRWDAPIDMTPVCEQVLKACAKSPDATALDFLGRKTKFRELGEAIEAFAGALQKKLGVVKGTRVALMLPNTPFYVIAYYGVLRAGGTVVFLGLPGGLGTLEEVFEAVTWTMLGIHAKPVGLLSIGGYYDPLEELLDRARDQGFLRPEHRALMLSDGDPATLVERLTQWEPVHASRWTPSVAPPA